MSEESKAYRLYNPITKKVLTSIGVIFDENEKWSGGGELTEENNELVDSGDRESDEEEAIEGEGRITKAEPRETSSEAINDRQNNVENNTTAAGSENNSGNQDSRRMRRKPSYLNGYVTGDEELGEFNLVVFTQAEDPTSYEEALREEKLRKAMKVELEAVEINQTWELSALPEETKSIGIKWIFKTKYNEKGEVEKYKARLTANGYSQKKRVDYKEVFAPMGHS